MNSALNIIKIILLSIIAIALILILIFLLNGKLNIKGFTLYEKTELIYEETFEGDINSLKVLTTYNDVRIEEADQEMINIKVYDRKDAKPEVYVENNTLNIVNESDKKIGFSFGIMGNSKIVITVPKTSNYSLNVEGTSSDIDALIDLDNVKINTKSGDINLKDSITSIVKTTSGDIKLGDVSKNLEATATSGDISVGEVNGKLVIATTSGDVSINKLNLTSNSSIKVTSGDVTIGKTNDIYIDAKVTSGDSKINVNNRHASYELKINTKSGDIIVNN